SLICRSLIAALKFLTFSWSATEWTTSSATVTCRISRSFGLLVQQVARVSLESQPHLLITRQVQFRNCLTGDACAPDDAALDADDCAIALVFNRRYAPAQAIARRC